MLFACWLGIARGLGNAGAAVAIVGRGRAKSSAVVAELRESGADADAFVADLRDDYAIVSVAERFGGVGGVDVVAANPGTNTRRRPAEYMMELWNSIVDGNLGSVWRAVRPTIRDAAARRGQDHFGRKANSFLTPKPARGQGSRLKIRIFAIAIGISGLVVSGCSSSHGTAVRSTGVVRPAGIIRSARDLQRYLSATGTSPLSALSSGARERFLSSITFGATGISGFRYADLQGELTATQVYDVLRLFGVQKDVAIIPNVRVDTPADKRVVRTFPFSAKHIDGGDYRDYRCASRATCSQSPGDICTSNC
ncbi:MAG TPA: SDR family NAD(P)-dependent oxidoreductase [Candidatus Elarobacter sp.]|nr:SDR family NAD(P)-dependent oxidoreductase [Candidatus Elarobacter sp.]